MGYILLQMEFWCGIPGCQSSGCFKSMLFLAYGPTSPDDFILVRMAISVYGKGKVKMEETGG